MRTTKTSGMAILTCATLLVFVGGSSTSALAAQAGMGGGSNVGHNTPSHPSAFGRGFATAVLASSGETIGGPGALTSNDRWGPHKTVAFGNLTRGWGPYEVNRKPGFYQSELNVITGVPVKCPCVVAYDPFNKRINGGVDLPETKMLAIGVRDETSFDQFGDVGASFSFAVVGSLMEAVWGPHFDPTPYHHGSN